MPRFLTRVRAALAGERSAAALEALRAAGHAVYGELDWIERHRAELVTAGGDVWDPPPAAATHALATWNAFVLLTLGEVWLDSDYLADPGTVGFVTHDVYEQTWWWLGCVPGWLSRARQARSNPEYDIGAELALPVRLPWTGSWPEPPEHLTELLAAAGRIREHVEVAVFALERGARDDRRREVNTLRQLLAAAGAAADSAASMSPAAADRAVRAMVAAYLRRALGIWYMVGQIAANPRLMNDVPEREPKEDQPWPPEQDATRPPVSASTTQLPGGPRFDPWCLTDPVTRPTWQADEPASRAVDQLWAADPNPAATLQMRAEIDSATTWSDVVPLRLADGVTCYHRCPWSGLYEVRRPVTIGGRTLQVLQQFALDVSADGLAFDQPFVRRIVVGPFTVTYASGYANPVARDT